LKVILKEHLLASKTVNKFYAAAWGIILLTTDTSATPLANKQLTEDVKGALQTLKTVKSSLLNYQAIAAEHRLYAHLFASPENQYFRSLDKTAEKEETSSFGLKEDLDDPTRNKQSVTTLIEAFCDPQNVESIAKKRNTYLITLDNPKPGQYFGTGYTFDFYKKQWYQGPYNQVQVKLEENGFHSFYPILDKNQLREVTKPQKTEKNWLKNEKNQILREQLSQKERTENANAAYYERKQREEENKKLKNREELSKFLKQEEERKKSQQKKSESFSSKASQTTEAVKEILEEAVQVKSNDPSTCCQKLTACIKRALALISSPFRQTEYQPIPQNYNND
jgi:hypothetical protein